MDLVNERTEGRGRMRKNVTHRMDADKLGAPAMEMGNTLRARQQEAVYKQAMGIKLNRAERRALKRRRK